MPQDLNYGYQKPEAGDESESVFFDILANNWQRISDHVHDGNDSALIAGSSITKYQTDLTAQKLSFTGLNYTDGDAIIDLLSLGATAGMYASSDDLPTLSRITSITGTQITLSVGVTGTNSNGTIELSNWERTNNSVYQRTVTLPSGYPSSTSFFKFYVITVDDDYENHEIFPTVVYEALNQVTVKVNNNDYDIKMVVF